jgi:WD40 repeat protein
MHASPVKCAVLDPAGLRVLTAAADSTARIWDAATSRLLTPLLHNGPVSWVAFNGTGDLAITASDDNTARVWDAHLGEAVTPPLKHAAWGKLLHASFSPDGRRVATASEDGSARIWDLPVCEMEIDELMRLALVLSGRQIEGGRLVPLGVEATRKIWERRP